jgi:ribosome modulation factor
MALERQREATRLGCVAFHHRKSVAACPYEETDSCRQDWLNAFDQASMRPLRIDVPTARAKGQNAFWDGVYREECPFRWRTPERWEWLDGWDRAQKLKKQQDEETYR